MSTKVQSQTRLDFVDVLRGLAVLLMLWMHSADAWLLPAIKHGRSWDIVRSIGGLAAPSFLLLSGMGVGLGWTRPSRRPDAYRMELARGLQIIVLGYALRAQMWFLDAEGYRTLSGCFGTLLLALAYVAAYQGARAWAEGRPFVRAAIFSAAALTLLWGHSASDPLVPRSLLRVDVLQAIGASIVVLVLLRKPLRRAPWLGVVLGLVVALATVWFRSWVPGPLPDALAAYLAQWPAAPGARAASLFPLFPWLAYALVGASVGIAIGQATQHGKHVRLVLQLSGVGVLLALLSCEPLPLAAYALRTYAWLEHPIRVGYRVGVVLVLLALLMPLARNRVLRAPLVTLGQSSLFVYWVHLELTFGLLGRPFVRELGYPQWLLGFGVLSVVMTVLAGAWKRFRRREAGVRSVPATSTTSGLSGA